MRLCETIVGYDIPLPDDPARVLPRFYRRAETVRTNDGILDTAAVDAASDRRETACFHVLVTDWFSYK